MLREVLRLAGISYVFLGKELGGRPTERALYCEGVADYEKMAKTNAFTKGLGRVVEGRAHPLRVVTLHDLRN